jgi:hypothetical protein
MYRSDEVVKEMVNFHCDLSHPSKIRVHDNSDNDDAEVFFDCHDYILGKAF